MKKIFILAGEPSGDKLASKIISKLKSSRSDIEYLSVGGEHLKSLGIKSLYDLNEVTYLGFTKVLFNIFKIKKKINETTKEIIKFKPDILFSVDSPDFTLRVAKAVKKINPNIKTIHYVAPQVWLWRENRTKKIKKFIDHLLLLFDFEKKYFEKENVNCTFVGHPLLDDKQKNKVDLGYLVNKGDIFVYIWSKGYLYNRNFEFKFLKSKNKKIICIFLGRDIKSLKLKIDFMKNQNLDTQENYFDESFNDEYDFEKKEIATSADSYADLIFNHSTDNKSYIKSKNHKGYLELKNA